MNRQISSRTLAGVPGVKSHLKAQSRRRREEMRSLAEVKRQIASCRNDLLPALAVDLVAINCIRPAKRRIRKDDAVQVERVAASIAKFGVCQPVLVDRDKVIVHGHTVWLAAKKLGLTHIPAVAIEHLTSDELRLLSIALNRLGETGQWEFDNLRLEMRELIEFDEDLLLTGFEAPEIDMLLLDDSDDGQREDDKVPAIQPEHCISRPGDLWRLGRHLLLHGDARDPTAYVQLFADGAVARLVLTDEPYNVPNVGHVTSQIHHREFAMAAGEMDRETFTIFNRGWIKCCMDHLADGGLLATFIDWRSVELVLQVGREEGLDLLNLVVWAKTNGGQGGLWRSQHELLPVFKKGAASHTNNVQLGKFGRWRSNVWTYPGASSLGSDARALLGDHPTVKPCAMLEDAMLDVTERGDVVLDPFLGSGSTLMAAEVTGRLCRSIEIDGLYCDVIIRRWQAMTGIDAILGDTSETFQSVEEQRRKNGGAPS